jgi:predicted ribosome quality control (RQC) complex YloA/Tae2 family protein
VTLDAALDELYGAPLDTFVATRNRLAKELGGDEGRAVAKLRKPNRAAWVLNQLAREHRREVDLLLDAGHRLRQAGLDKEAVDRARTAESDALKQLTRAAEGLGARGQALAQVNESLRAAAVGEAGRELLARGRFTEPLQATGFEAYEGIELPKRKPKPRRRTISPERKRAEAELRELERRLEAARRTTEQLEAQVEAAQQRLRDVE